MRWTTVLSVVLLVVLVYWTVPALQLFVQDHFLDRDFELPESFNSGYGSVLMDGRDPVAPELFYWRDGKSRHL